MTTRQYIIAQIAKITAMKNEQLRWGHGMVETIKSYRRSSTITLEEMNYLDGQTEKAKDKFFKDCTLAAAALIEQDEQAAAERQRNAITEHNKRAEAKVAARENTSEIRRGLVQQLAHSMALTPNDLAGGVKGEILKRAKSGYFYEKEQKYWDSLSQYSKGRLIRDVETLFNQTVAEWAETNRKIAEWAKEWDAEELETSALGTVHSEEAAAVDEIISDEEAAALAAAVQAEIEAGMAEANQTEPVEDEPNERRSPTIRQRTITRLASEMWFEHRVSCNKDWTWINATFLDMGGDYWEYYHEVGAAEMLAVIAAAETLAATLQAVL